MKVFQGFFLFLSLVWSRFFLFVGSAYAKDFVGSYYFLQLVALMFILLVSSLVLMVFW